VVQEVMLFYEFIKGSTVQRGPETVYIESDAGGSYTVNVYDDNNVGSTT
jgi:hypothetical protein